MEKWDEHQRSEKRVIQPFLRALDEFEQSVRGGHNVNAAIAARAIVKILRRFHPETLMGPSLTASSLDPPFTIAGPIQETNSEPDPHYVEAADALVKRAKRALILHDIQSALDAFAATGVLRDQISPLEEMSKLEIEIARLNGHRRLFPLCRIAKLALWLHRPDQAKSYASEVLQRVGEYPAIRSDERGQGIHDGNLVLGMVVLTGGDVNLSRDHLAAASRSHGSEELRDLGPNLSLADDLLIMGERDAVTSYLQNCRRFWAFGAKSLDRWIQQIQIGEMADFGFSMTV